MSNRPNDFDDDDFRFDADDDDFRFDADDDVDFDGGLGDDFDADLPALDDEVGDAEGRGPSRTFIIIAAIMIILFIVAIGVLVFLSRDTGPTPFELTSTSIALTNARTIAQGLETSTQSALFLLTETQIAAEATLTAQAPTVTPTPSPSPSATATPTIDPTNVAATAIALNTQLALTQQAQPQLPTLSVDDVGRERIEQAATNIAAVILTQIPAQVGQLPDVIQQNSTAIAGGLQGEAQGPGGAIIGVVAQAVTPIGGIFQTQIAGQIDPAAIQLTSTAVADLFGTALAGQGGGGEVSLPAVAQTATALAAILQQPTLDQGGGVASPTAEGTTFGPRPTALPDTGLFDDIAGGSPGGLGAILLAIAGLVGVIVISRRLRSSNK